ncbi:MAG: LuxR C-terminal-related transcriptional regulator [Spirochaetota bacterium]
MKENINTDEALETLDLLEDIIFSISNINDFEKIEFEYLNSISHLIPAHATALYLLRPDKKEPQRIGARGVDMNFLTYYEKKGRELDPLIRWITKQKTPNQSQLLLGLKGWQNHPVYNIVGTASIDFAMQSPIVSGRDVIGTLNFGRDTREGPFSATDLKVVSIISKFLSMAISKSIVNDRSRNQKGSLYNYIEHVPQGVVITDSEYSIQYSNSAAKIISERNFDGCYPEKDLSALLRHEAAVRGKYGLLRRNNLNAKFCPMPGSDSQQSIIFLDEELELPASSPISQLLTRREIEVLRFLDKGMSNREIADKLMISTNTVKRHLDNIYGKLNVKCRTELISKIYKWMNSRIDI